MKKSNDDYRKFIDEVETMIENEKKLFRDLKDTFRMKDIESTLAPSIRSCFTMLS